MLKIKVTPARKSQVEDYIKLALATGESFLKNIFNPYTEKQLTLLYLHPDNSFSHTNVKYAQLNGKITGMILSYPGGVHLKKQLKTTVIMIKQYIKYKTTPSLQIIKASTFFGPSKKTDYYICFLAVNPDYKRRKIGSTLLEYAKREAAETNCKRIVLETDNNNVEALKFYLNKGFETVKTTVLKIKGEKYYYRKMSLKV